MEKQSLTRGNIGLWSVIFSLAAAAPLLAGVVGALPPAFMPENSAGIPSIYLLSGALLNIYYWNRFAAPLLSLFGMSTTLVLVINNIDVLNGSKSSTVFALPYLLFGAAVCGYIGVLIIKKMNPEYYQKVGQLIESA